MKRQYCTKNEVTPSEYRRDDYRVPLTVKTEDVKDDGTFSGYGSTFNGEPDAYNDIVLPGAFGQSIKNGGRNGTGIVMLYQHDSWQVPGLWDSIVEDQKGLAMDGSMIMETQLGRETHALLKRGALKGLSIGFDLIDFEIRNEKDVKTGKTQKIRYIKEADLWEVSVVTFPANVHALITGVKAFEAVQTMREMEQALRDVGLSISQAKYVAGLCRGSLRDVESNDSELLPKELILETLKNFTFL